MKVRKTHTVDDCIYVKFLEICDKKSIKASTWINNKIKEFVEQEGQEMELFMNTENKYKKK